MITGITYGTFILFGLLIALGAAFIWFYVPETSRLTLEEMDIVFGSSGVAAEDQTRMQAINEEIGLEERIRHLTGRSMSAGAKGMTEKEASHHTADRSSESSGHHIEKN